MNYTLEQLKQSKSTIMKYILSKDNITYKDLEECRRYYNKNSKNKDKKYNFNPSRFIKELNVYNNRIK